jgi:hypothetical protein
MKLSLLRIAGPGLLAVLAGALIWANCRTPPDGNGSPPPSIFETELVEPSQSAQQEQACRAVLAWSIRTRWALADEVISGRLTLPEAAAGFRAVDQVKERYVPVVESVLQGETPEERLCRRVIAFVATRLDGSGERETLGRLEDDLQKHLRCTMGLPQFRRPQSIPWFDP